MSLSDDTINTFHMVHELIMCRDGSFSLCNDFFDKTKFIDNLCTKLRFHVLVNCVLFFFLVLYCMHLECEIKY